MLFLRHRNIFSGVSIGPFRGHKVAFTSDNPNGLSIFIKKISRVLMNNFQKAVMTQILSPKQAFLDFIQSCFS